MAIIIDAYNVLHQTHRLPEPYALMDPAGLCRAIERSRWSRTRAMVVCDGVPKPDEGAYDGAVELIYAGPGGKADPLIEKLIERDDGPRELIVVSDDNRLKKAARKRRAKAMSSGAFLRELVASIEAGPPGSGASPPNPDAMGSTEAWLREFGFEE